MVSTNSKKLVYLTIYSEKSQEVPCTGEIFRTSKTYTIFEGPLNVQGYIMS